MRNLMQFQSDIQQFFSLGALAWTDLHQAIWSVQVCAIWCVQASVL